jgi:TP901 family phage tail tape measure protein
MAEPIGEAYVVVTADIEDVKKKLGVIKNMFAKLKTSGGGGFGGLLTTLSKLANIVTALATAFMAITKIIGFFINILKKLVSIVANIVVGALKLLARVLTGIVKAAFGAVASAIRLTGEALKALYRQLRRAIDTFMVFENAMLTVKAISGATGKSFDQLKQKALSLGRSTEFTASQAAEAMTNFSRAGFKTQQILDAIGGTLDFATAAATSMHQATEIVTGVLGSLNLEATQTAHAMDVLIVASNNARTTAVELGEAFGRVGAIGAFMGTDITNLSASLMSLAESSMRGLEGGMQLRMMLRRFTDPKVVESFKKLNVQLFTTQGNLRKSHEIIKDFEDATRGWNKQQKTAIVLQTLTARSSYPFLALLQQGSEAIKKNWEMLQKVNGSTKKFAKTIRASLVKQLIIVTSAWQDFQIVIAETFSPTIIAGAKVLVALINDLANNLRGIQPAIMSWLGGGKGAKTFINRLLKDLENFLNDAEAKIKSIWNWITKAADALGAMMGAAGGGIASFFGQQAGGTAQSAIEDATKMHGSRFDAGNMFTKVFIGVIAAVTNIENWIKKLIIFLNEMLIALKDLILRDLPHIFISMMDLMGATIVHAVKSAMGMDAADTKPYQDALTQAFGISGDRFISAWDRTLDQWEKFDRSQTIGGKPFAVGQGAGRTVASGFQQHMVPGQVPKPQAQYDKEMKEWSKLANVAKLAGPLHVALLKLISPKPSRTEPGMVPDPLFGPVGGGVFGGLQFAPNTMRERILELAAQMSGPTAQGATPLGTQLLDWIKAHFPKLMAAIKPSAGPMTKLIMAIVPQVQKAVADRKELWRLTPAEKYREMRSQFDPATKKRRFTAEEARYEADKLRIRQRNDDRQRGQAMVDYSQNSFLAATISRRGGGGILEQAGLGKGATGNLISGMPDVQKQMREMDPARLRKGLKELGFTGQQLAQGMDLTNAFDAAIPSNMATFDFEKMMENLMGGKGMRGASANVAELVKSWKIVDESSWGKLAKVPFYDPERLRKPGQRRPLKERIAAAKEERDKARAALKRKTFATRAEKLGLSPEELRSRLDAVGQRRPRVQRGPTGATIGMTGTIQTIHGAMKVQISEEVMLLKEQVRLQRLIAVNTQVVALT